MLDFEDRGPSNDSSAILSDEYQSMGVTFGSSDDGATWGGISGGDVGSWQIEGTRGPAFLGFDGRSYSATIDFDEPVTDFQLDVARGQGRALQFVDSVLVAGFRDGAFTEVVEILLGGVDRWQTIALTGEVDRVLISGSGIRGMRFGVDNLQWSQSLEAPLELEVDIRPGSEKNQLNPGSRGVVPVLVYGSEELDVDSIDPDTLTFGPGPAALAHRHGPHLFDADGDGWIDLLGHYRTRASELGFDDFEACVAAETFDGQLAEGCDVVTPVPRR
jgi:hypothetical protein